MKIRTFLLVAAAIFIVSCQLDSSTKQLAPNYILTSVDNSSYSLNQENGACIIGGGLSAYSVEEKYIF